MGDARAVIARLKAAAAGDARAFESMTVRATASRRARDAMRARRPRPTWTTRRSATDGAANGRRTDRRTRTRGEVDAIARDRRGKFARVSSGNSRALGTLAEACARSGDARRRTRRRTDDASATTDASREALDASASEADDDESTLEGARRALARSQARARIELAEARRARARADAMADALRRAGVDAPPA